MRFALLASLMCFSTHLFCQTYTPEEALEKGLIKIQAQSLGGHSGTCAQVVFINVAKERLKIVLTPGDVLVSDDSLHQNLLLVHAETFYLPPNKKRTLPMTAFCCSMLKSAPNAGGQYAFKGKINAQLAQTASYLYTNKLQHMAFAQQAVWAVSDNAGLQGIYDAQHKTESRKLVEFLARLTGQKVPWYQAELKKAAPGPAMAKRKMTKMHANWTFELEAEAVLTFGVFDSAGKEIALFFRDKNYKYGKYEFSFSYETNKLEAGKYYFRMTDAKGNKVKEREIDMQ